VFNSNKRFFRVAGWIQTAAVRPVVSWPKLLILASIQIPISKGSSSAAAPATIATATSRQTSLHIRLRTISDLLRNNLCLVSWNFLGSSVTRIVSTILVTLKVTAFFW